MSDKDKPIIIKKIKKGGHGGHHGGAWKVAYADFVTAMMAFFLLMWLLNATSEVQKKGLSNYFGPSGDMIGAGGSGGVLGGVSIQTEGLYQDAKPTSTLSSEVVSTDSAASETENQEKEGAFSSATPIDIVKKEEEDIKAGKEGEEKILLKEKDKEKNAVDVHEQKNMEEIQKIEKDMFDEAEHQIRQAIQKIPDLKDLAKNLIIDRTPDGLRIQIVDRDGYSMFGTGSADMQDRTKELLKQVAKVIQKLPNKISLTGHTDSRPYSGNATYTNWELSTDRANATRRTLLESGLSIDRMSHVIGKADNDPLIPSNPASEQNRRISIVLHHTEKSKEGLTLQKNPQK